MNRPPAGDPGDFPTVCLQCPQPIGAESSFYWLGFNAPGEEPDVFWGYFCSDTCRQAFMQRNEFSRLVSLFRSPEAVEKYFRLARLAVAREVRGW